MSKGEKAKILSSRQPDGTVQVRVNGSVVVTVDNEDCLEQFGTMLEIGRAHV